MKVNKQMREIKFRGKRVDNKEWIIGSYIYDPASEKIFITCGWFPQQGWDIYEVIPETAGQFVDNCDIVGNAVYEDDIGKLGEYVCVLKFNVVEGKFWWIDIVSNQYIVGRPSDATIIGNIHDTPSLLQNED